jgi:hypothetical protein
MTDDATMAMTIHTFQSNALPPFDAIELSP